MHKVLYLVLTAALFAAPAVWAQQKGALDIKTISEVEITRTTAEGKKAVKRIDAAMRSVAPGQTVIYTNTYTYSGDKPATDVVIKNPVPEHMIYVEGSAEGKGTKIEFSVDKGRTFAAAEKLKITTPDGKERRAAASDYTHIRWTIEKPLHKGAKGSVSFRARVK
jgi:uncharacterized repeat protein (TIGR01451 family)